MPSRRDLPTRGQVVRLLDAGMDYEAAARRLGVPAGLAYMIATGLPADGGDTLTDTEARRPGLLPAGSQHLAQPGPAENPGAKDVVAGWLKQRAAGDAQMRRAARRREATTAPPPEQEPGATREATAVLTRDHNHVTAHLKQLATIPGHTTGGTRAQLARRRAVVDAVLAAVTPHETAEQQHLWPAVRAALDDGDALADSALERHRQGERTLTALRDAAPDSEEFDDLVEELTAHLRKHVAFQDAVFARLRAALPPEELDRLGEKLLRAKKSTPASRPPNP